MSWNTLREIALERVDEKHPKLPTKWNRLNVALGGGLPLGRMVEIYGPSQIGKTSVSLQINQDAWITYLCLDRKICSDYVHGLQNGSNVTIIPGENLNDNKIFEFLSDTIKLDTILIIDDLPKIGEITNDKKRFIWLKKNFTILQNKLGATKSILIILNEIRQNPNTNQTYSAHERVISPDIRIKMHLAERIDRGKRVYLDIEPNFWNENKSRCTLIVKKNIVEET